MISFYNTYGKVSMTNSYFAELVAAVTQSGFGVAGITTNHPADALKSFMSPEFTQKGIQVTEEQGKLIIDLRIVVAYGLNISAAVKSISHRIQYTVEEATGLKVKRINVSVEDVVV